jgi:ABC-type Fe3+ transport system substrate-binding protein
MGGWTGRIIVLALLIATLLLPLLWARPRPAGDAAARRLVIVTPHNEQIRYEFGRAFSRWHQQTHGESVEIDWRSLGGTSDIRRMLISRYEKLAKAGRENEGAGFDMMFGGGAYEFDYQLKPGVRMIRRDDRGNPVTRRVSISVPTELPAELIAAAYPTRRIADEKLYDAQDGHWYGVVLSSFGIAYNRDVLERLGLPEPTTWADLADPRYDRWVALADPAHSGSVRVTYDAILQRYGFDNADADDPYAKGFLRRSGIKTLRRVFANARYFAPGSNKVPTDVSHGEAAAGICIDFYGRYQSQVIGGGRRVGFVAPAGSTLISADPIAVLRGAKNRELATRFIQFLLTEQGQAIWCFERGVEVVRETGESKLRGPERFELRRSPIRRDMYAKHLEHMTDKVDPFDIARAVPEGTPSYFGPLPTLLHAMCMDVHTDLQAAWRTVYACDDPALKAKLRIEFDKLPFTRDELRAAAGRWRNDPRAELEDRMAWTDFFRDQYARVVRMAEAGR